MCTMITSGSLSLKQERYWNIMFKHLIITCLIVFAVGEALGSYDDNADGMQENNNIRSRANLMFKREAPKFYANRTYDDREKGS